MKKLPIGIQSLPEIINGGYIYVDKTECLYRLIDTGKVYFFSRPRRFGKSLTVSALKEIFSGNKELFKGLWIHDKIEWKKYPVIHIDFSKIGYKDNGLLDAINVKLDDLAKEFSVRIVKDGISKKFNELIEKVSDKQKVTVLIDEYDKPIIDFIEKGQVSKALENREILKNFYSVLNGNDDNIQFLFITGVSKFSKVSVFSDLNHLTDITIYNNYINLIGLTGDEIVTYFDDYLEAASKKHNKSKKEILLDIRDWYDGYSWNGIDFVYNPFSLINYFSKLQFRNYWFATGTPTFLIKALKEQKKLPEQTGNILVGDSFFDKFDIENIDIVSLMFQSGYLTMSKREGEEYYRLDFPNREVRNSFFNQLLECYSDLALSETTGSIGFIKFALEKNDWCEVVKQFNVLFSNIPYQLFKADREFYYHSIIHTVLSLVGVDIHSELQTSTGRIDTVVKNDKYIYVVEFKMGNASEALKQIKEKEYYKPFLNDGRQVVLVGIGFDKEKKEIGEWLVE
ncbi:MAG: ATP-binding protein [Bacteroidetes bacterium]|nr:ATP-binding protein [Bacteroidota bacterium]